MSSTDDRRREEESYSPGRGPADDALSREHTPSSPRDEELPPEATALKPNTDVKYVHPESAGIAAKAPRIFRIPFYGRSVQYLGPKLPSTIAIANFMQRGIGNNLITYSQYAVFVRHFGVSGERYQRLAGVAGLGWSLMALTAVFTDSVALFHYTKRWYIVFSCITGFAFSLGLGLMPPHPSSGNVGAAFLFLSVWSIANVIVLVAGQYSRALRKTPQAGPYLVGVVYGTIMIGGIIAAAIQGPLSDNNIMQVGLYIAAGAQLVPLPFFALNWLQEKTNRVGRLEDSYNNYYQELEEAKRWDEEHGADGETLLATQSNSADVPLKRAAGEEGELVQVGGAAMDDDVMVEDDEVPMQGMRRQDQVVRREPAFYVLPYGIADINYRVITENWKIVAYCIIMTCGVIAMTVVTVLGSSYDLLYCSVAVAVVCIILSFLCLTLTIAKAIVYIFLQQLLYLQLPGLLDSFYTATPECLPDGPHFNFTFYTTVASIIGNVGGLLGLALFTYVFSKMSYRVTMVFATIVQIIASIFDLIMIERWNIYIGIPDHAMYIFGDQIVYKACYYLSYTPIVLLLSRLLPRGTECMVMALMSSFGNFGAALSSSIGALLIELVWPFTADGVTCDFHNGYILILVGHFALPCVILPLCLMLPAAKISDDIDIDGKVIRKKVKEDAHHDRDADEENSVADEEPLGEGRRA